MSSWASAPFPQSSATGRSHFPGACQRGYLSELTRHGSCRNLACFESCMIRACCMMYALHACMYYVGMYYSALRDHLEATSSGSTPAVSDALSHRPVERMAMADGSGNGITVSIISYDRSTPPCTTDTTLLRHCNLSRAPASKPMGLWAYWQGYRAIGNRLS